MSALPAIACDIAPYAKADWEDVLDLTRVDVVLAKDTERLLERLAVTEAI
jgi:hypothetical protein